MSPVPTYALSRELLAVLCFAGHREAWHSRPRKLKSMQVSLGAELGAEWGWGSAAICGVLEGQPSSVPQPKGGLHGTHLFIIKDSNEKPYDGHS